MNVVVFVTFDRCVDLGRSCNNGKTEGRQTVAEPVNFCFIDEKTPLDHWFCPSSPFPLSMVMPTTIAPPHDDANHCHNSHKQSYVPGYQC